MYTKIVAFIIQNYVHSKAFSPPVPNSNTNKILSTEGLVGLAFAKLLPILVNTFNLVQSLFYISIMIQQEIGSVPIKNHKFSEWNSLDMIWFSCTVGGSLLRIWCFKALKDHFTFHVTIKDDHKLITTGPYSLLVHPSYTGATLVTANYLLTYQLYDYLPTYSYSLLNVALILCAVVFMSGNMVANVITYRRITYEESALRKRFGKAWDVYFSQRKRFIPYII